MLKRNFHSQGGLEKQSHRIANAIAKRGYKLTILTTGEQVIPNHPNINFEYFESDDLVKFDNFCNNFIKKIKPRAILGLDRNSFQTHLRLGGGIHHAYLESRKKSNSLLKYWTSLLNPKHRTLLALERKALLHPDLKKIITNSYMVKEEVIKYYGVDPEKIVVIHNGVEYEATKNLWEVEKREAGFHFLFVGNGYKRKGLVLLLKAFVHLPKETRLSVIGKDKNEQKYRRLAHLLGIEERVSFLGVKEDIFKFYKLADALVIPSFYDPFANVTLEALAMGLFLISSKYNGGAEVITKENGIVMDNSVENLVQALKIALTKPKTIESALKIRESVKGLEINHQIEKLIDVLLC